MELQITNSTLNDIETIFKFYKFATDFQKAKSMVSWPEFDRRLIEQEIEEERQWKLISDRDIACVWATTFDDPEIWEERNDDSAVYIHRIATNPDFRGRNLVNHIVNWAIGHAAVNNKNFVRLDTVGENRGLIDHYTKCGFDFLGLKKLHNTTGLPAHYDNATVSLFEIRL
ncbi:GNAT family N-acetyltransferase [Sphingobacterium sp.]|uniref:GNAT family N-acetyltransferase n=1 Tax=Sphingobacterium sp. TaxID=341027 RepID=UPI0031D4B843